MQAILFFARLHVWYDSSAVVYLRKQNDSFIVLGDWTPEDQFISLTTLSGSSSTACFPILLMSWLIPTYLFSITSLYCAKIAQGAIATNSITSAACVLTIYESFISLSSTLFVFSSYLFGNLAHFFARLFLAASSMLTVLTTGLVFQFASAFIFETNRI